MVAVAGRAGVAQNPVAALDNEELVGAGVGELLNQSRRSLRLIGRVSKFASEFAAV